jgi:hypothetical protein
MRSPRTVHVIVDARGRIVGAAVLNDEESFDSLAQVRLAALDGQRVIEVELPQEINGLKTLEDFGRLCEHFRLPAGQDQLVRRERSKPGVRRRKVDKQERPKKRSAAKKAARPRRT